MKTGEHVIIDFSVTDCKHISEESDIDSFLCSVTEAAGMTLAVPPVSFKFPVDNIVIENCRTSLAKSHLEEERKKRVFETLVERAGSGNLGGFGVSGTAIWVESHCAVHTWTDKKFVTLDMFSCRSLNLSTVLELVKNYFSVSSGRFLKLERFTDRGPLLEKGVLYDDERS